MWFSTDGLLIDVVEQELKIITFLSFLKNDLFILAIFLKSVQSFFV